jgi:heterotetrameric sarcosine oxidase delta subunit
MCSLPAMSGVQITCPNCGERAASEFTFGGEWIPYPSGAAETLEQDYARVWLRENAYGVQTEQWYHGAGCRRWFKVERDTVTNETRTT